MSEPTTPTGKRLPNFHRSYKVECGVDEAELTKMVLAIEAEVRQQDREVLNQLLPGLKSLLVLDAESFGRVIGARPDVWTVLRAFLDG